MGKYQPRPGVPEHVRKLMSEYGKRGGKVSSSNRERLAEKAAKGGRQKGKRHRGEEPEPISKHTARQRRRQAEIRGDEEP